MELGSGVIQCLKPRSCCKFNHVVTMSKLFNLNNIRMHFCCNSLWLVRFCLNASNKGSVQRINLVSGHFARSGNTKWNWVELADCFWSGADSFWGVKLANACNVIPCDGGLSMAQDSFVLFGWQFCLCSTDLQNSAAAEMELESSEI